MQQGITLHYFDMFGRGEPLRMMLKYHNTPFVDHRLTQQEWNQMMSQGFSEFDMLPCLDIDGMRLTEPCATYKYVAQKLNYYPNPTNLVDCYMVDSVSNYREHVRDIFKECYKNRDMEGIERLMNEKMPTILRKIEARLNRVQNGNRFFMGNNVTLADFMIFDMVYNYMMCPGRAERYGNLINQNAPKLAQWCQRMINSSETFKEYLETRPVKEM
ncbi:unnamed protein product [Blepharisma stoltei]|uniref:Glutathione S-transferase n=1 Tax=Blepharisma stoltei TaxID=1481888 RepID=A0AAU9IDB4_9CILI|nr:unnamed protein product [Blepharisma stoltei]